MKLEDITWALKTEQTLFVFKLDFANEEMLKLFALKCDELMKDTMI